MGIDDSGKLQKFPYGSTTPRQVANALWFKTTDNSADPTQGSQYSASSPLLIEEMPANPTEQPLLVPVLQLQNTNGEPPSNPDDGGIEVKETRWIIRAAETTFNLVAAAGDTPNRVNTKVAESNGGLPNLVRFLENWTNATPAKIGGSFIQLKRSSYATAPFTTVFSDEPGGIFNYRQAYRTANGSLDNGWGSLPFFIPPQRQWEFDIGLLSQLPDLFSQRFTLPAASEPNEFFREVSQDDSWIQTLLCAAVKENLAPNSIYEKYAVDDGQRPSCPQPLSSYQ
jgi:hypothetical protein